MKKLTLFLLFISYQTSFAQSTSIVSATINKIEFEEDTIQSVFTWITSNIQYDVDKLNEIKDKSKPSTSSTFKTTEEYKEHLLKKVVKQKKGVCEDYSLLFDSIVKELGYESYIIEGYVKKKGKVSRIGHAWNVIKVDQKWRLYDSTWGAGYLNPEKKFIKRYTPKWYDVDPKEMIKTHMPFDPLWQLSSSPVSYEVFENNLEHPLSEKTYNYEALIDEYGKKDKQLQMQDQVKRSKEMGEGILLIDKWRKRLTKNRGAHEVRNHQDLLQEARESSTKAVELFNTYIMAKSKQFKGKKWAIEKAEQNLLNSKTEMQSALGIYQGIEVESKKIMSSIAKSINHSKKILYNVNKELNSLKKLKSN